MHQTQEQEMLKIPVSVFESAETKEDLEAWLFANDPSFIKEMERIKSEESGKGISLEEATKQWDIS